MRGFLPTRSPDPHIVQGSTIVCWVVCARERREEGKRHEVLRV